MKLLTKTTIVWTAIAVSMVLWEATKAETKTGSTAGKTTSPSSNSGTEKSDSPTSDKGITKDGFSNNVDNKDEGARKNRRPTKINDPAEKKKAIQELILSGATPESSTQILQFAQLSGATTAKIEGNVLKYTGSINQDKFASLVYNAYPNVNIVNK